MLADSALGHTFQHPRVEFSCSASDDSFSGRGELLRVDCRESSVIDARTRRRLLQVIEGRSSVEAFEGLPAGGRGLRGFGPRKFSVAANDVGPFFRYRCGIRGAVIGFCGSGWCVPQCSVSGVYVRPGKRHCNPRLHVDDLGAESPGTKPSPADPRRGLCSILTAFAR